MAARSGGECCLVVFSSAEMFDILFVCLCVRRTFSLRSRKWFKTFVSGTVRTEKTIRGHPQLGWGWTATVLRFEMLLLPDLTHFESFEAIICRHNQFAVLSVPQPAANRRHSIYKQKTVSSGNTNCKASHYAPAAPCSSRARARGSACVLLQGGGRGVLCRCVPRQIGECKRVVR
jgi:hypothetical protein